MAPNLIILPERRGLPIDPLPLGTAGHLGIEPPALDNEASAFGQVLPGMPPCNGGPADAERLEAGTQGEKHSGVITDDRVRRAPLRDRLAAHLDHTGEVLAIEAPSSHEGPAGPVEPPDTVEPASIDLDQRPHIDAPNLMGSGRGDGPFFSPGRVRWRCGSGVGLLIEGDHLPHRRVAIAIPQGI